MKNHCLNSDELDRRFSSLFRAADLSDLELEKVVDAPDLFRSIREEIRTKQQRDARSFRLEWKNSTVWNWQSAVAFAGLVVAFALSLIAYVAGEYDSSLSVALENSVEVSAPDVSHLTDSNLIAEKSDRPARRMTALVGIKRNKSVVRTRSTLRQSRAESEEVGKFYALPYAADLADSDETGEIVRVELPRSSLLAMGVIVQIENQNTDTIKADLLIGEDGLMKAVRLIDE